MSTLIESDAIVIGGGIVGSSAALALALKGKRVALLERDFCGSHSSGVNYGGVRRQGRPLSQLPLSQRAHQIWSGLRELIGIDGEYQRSGHLKLARSERDMDALRSYAEASRGSGWICNCWIESNCAPVTLGRAMSPSVHRCAPTTGTPIRVWYRPPLPAQLAERALRYSSRRRSAKSVTTATPSSSRPPAA